MRENEALRALNFTLTQVEQNIRAFCLDRDKSNERVDRITSDIAIEEIRKQELLEALEKLRS